MKKKEFDMERFAELVMGEFQSLHVMLDAKFEKIDTDIHEVRSELNDVKSGMRDIQSEIYDIRRSQDRMEVQLENHSGFAKEIDHVLGRVSRIEKHVCIEGK